MSPVKIKISNAAQRISLGLFVLTALWLPGCAHDIDTPARPNASISSSNEAQETLRLGPPREDLSLGDISKFLAVIAGADEVLVYEGLPHPAAEPELFATESKRADVIRFEGYPFYARPLSLTDVEKKQLTAIVLRPAAHATHFLDKFCLGFHPDYAVIWIKDGKKNGSLICFGCHEWKNFTPQGRLYEDLSTADYEALHAILSTHVAQRPKPAPAGAKSR